MRPIRAEICLEHLSHNLALVRLLAPKAKLMAVVKANAYGHGLEWLAPLAAQVDAWAVSSLTEAQLLRERGLSQPIVLLEGCFSADELQQAAQLDCHLVLHNRQQLAALERADIKPVNLWLKVDTGMHRLGFAEHEVADLLLQLQACRSVQQPVHALMHFANADDALHPLNAQQLRVWSRVTPLFSGQLSQANSAAIYALPEAHADWVRPGIMLYGVSPLLGAIGADNGLKPVMSLCSELISVRELAAGESVGYGSQWTSDRPTRIGIVAAGYADGYPRHAPNGSPVWLKDGWAYLAGRVSMDMLAVDLGPDSNAQVGDRVVLWGPELPVETLAKACGTIGYELLCAVSARVPRVLC